jgi:hypothetical protein
MNSGFGTAKTVVVPAELDLNSLVDFVNRIIYVIFAGIIVEIQNRTFLNGLIQLPHTRNRNGFGYG